MTPKCFPLKRDKTKSNKKNRKYQDIQKELFLAQEISSVQKPKSNIDSHENTKKSSFKQWQQKIDIDDEWKQIFQYYWDDKELFSRVFCVWFPNLFTNVHRVKFFECFRT